MHTTCSVELVQAKYKAFDSDMKDEESLVLFKMGDKEGSYQAILNRWKPKPHLFHIPS